MPLGPSTVALDEGGVNAADLEGAISAIDADSKELPAAPAYPIGAMPRPCRKLILESEREHVRVAETIEAWLLTLRERIHEVEGDTPEAFAKRRELVKLLVE